MALRSILVVFMLALALPAGAQHNERREYFRDFLVACRADNYCSATTYVNPNPPSGIVADYILRIGRHQDSPDWEISFSGVAELPRDDTDIAVVVDGERFDFAFPDQTRAYGAINDFYFTDVVADMLLTTMKDARQAEVYFRDHRDYLVAADFSLSGLVASMIWIDAQQGRDGSAITAGAPPVGLEPAFTGVGAYHIPDEVWGARSAATQCLALDELPHGWDVRVIRLSETSGLYIFPCEGGAYNLGYTLIYWDGDVARPLLFATFNAQLGWQGTAMLFNIEFDEARGELTSFEKGRGLGDCGSTGTWIWQGSVFEMVEFTHTDSCDGGEPDDFPVVYAAPGFGGDGSIATD